MRTSTRATASRWKEAAERGDPEAAATCLADEVELISPLTAQFRFKGRDQLHDVLVCAFQVINSIRYHTDVGDEETRALFYNGRVGDLEVEEAQLLRFDPDGRIRELTLFGRPLPAVTAVMADIVPGILRRQGKGRLAPVASAALAPLAAMTRFGDSRLAPLVDPTPNR